MKKIYFVLLLFSTILINSCSKDILKPFEDRIVGTWYISDINRIGIGGSSSEIRFREGTFQFNDDGTLVYTNEQGTGFNGSWDIQKRTIDGNLVRTLQVTAVDFNTQMVMSEFYDEMNFRGTNHFVAKINAPFRTFVTHFRR
jgi:hypothetical protein